MNEYPLNEHLIPYNKQEDKGLIAELEVKIIGQDPIKYQIIFYDNKSSILPQDLTGTECLHRDMLDNLTKFGLRSLRCKKEGDNLKIYYKSG